MSWKECALFVISTEFAAGGGAVKSRARTARGWAERDERAESHGRWRFLDSPSLHSGSLGMTARDGSDTRRHRGAGLSLFSSPRDGEAPIESLRFCAEPRERTLWTSRGGTLSMLVLGSVAGTLRCGG